MTFSSIAELHRCRAQALSPRSAVRFKRHGLYHDLSWRSYREQVEACAAALLDAGVHAGDRIAVLAENRVEWLVADVAMLAVGAVTVPLHAPLTAAQAQFQLADAGATWIFVSTAAQHQKISSMRSALPQLRGVVVFEGVANTDAMSWHGFLQQGRRCREKFSDELTRREQSLQPNSLATIMYTSGTTGNPKGVMLTHGNLLSNVQAFYETAPCGPEAVFLNWLPLSHIYARTVDHYHSMWAGVPLCLAESADTLVVNLREIQPTHMSSVPRFYEKVLAAVRTDSAEETARRLRGTFGSRIDWLGSGGAPLPPAIAEAYHAAGLLLLQGYGLTESSPVISFNRKERYRLDSVGPPLPGVEVRIADDGEVLTRGPHVMTGYWQQPEATAAALADGWLHTGDLGRLDDGFLTITGRKKDVIVLSNGKKVAPTTVEGKLLNEPCIDQVVVYGEGRSYLTALIVPHWGNVRSRLAGQVDASLPDAKLAAHAAVEGLFAERVAAAQAELAPWEQVKSYVLLPQPFSVAGDELTVSLKLRRNVIFDKHRAALDALYRE